MSSLAAQPELLPELLVWIIAFASLAICWRLGIFAPVSNSFDRRLGEDETPLALIVVMVFGAVSGWLATIMLLSVVRIDAKASPMEAHAVLYGCGFVGMLAARMAMRRDGISRMGLSPFRLVSGIPWSVIAILLTLPVVYAAGALILWLWGVMGWPKPAPHPILQELLLEGNTRRVRLLVLTATVLAPLAEETFFRALLQTTLSKFSRNAWFAIIVTAILFALVHGEPAFLFPLFILAVALGWVYERTGNLWATILMHALFNGFQVLVFLKWGAE